MFSSTSSFLLKCSSGSKHVQKSVTTHSQPEGHEEANYFHSILLIEMQQRAQKFFFFLDTFCCPSPSSRDQVQLYITELTTRVTSQLQPWPQTRLQRRLQMYNCGDDKYMAREAHLTRDHTTRVERPATRAVRDPAIPPAVAFSAFADPKERPTLRPDAASAPLLSTSRSDYAAGVGWPGF